MRPTGIAPAFALCAALSCGHAAPPLAASKPARAPAPARSHGRDLPSLSAAEVATVPKGTFGPYIGRDADRALLVWAAEERPDVRAWFGLAVGPGVGSGQKPRKLAVAPADIGVVAVRAVGDGAFAVMSTRRAASGEQVEVMLVAADGKLLGGPRRLAESTAPVLWVEAATIARRRLALWASKGSTGADVFAVALSTSGEPAGEVQKVAAGVSAWQVAVSNDALALGVVRGGRGRGSRGAIEVSWLGADGRALRAPTLIDSENSAELDLDLAQVGDRLVAVWSDRRYGEARLMAAALAADGTLVVPPAAFTAALGEQALVRVVSGANGAYALWENTSAAEGTGRAFEIASFGPEARASERRTRLWYAAVDGSLPEVAISAGGVALLTLATACRQGQACESDDAVPAFLELSSALEVRAFEPLRLQPLAGQAPDLAWGLTCLSKTCFALAARNETPARVYLADLQAKNFGWRLPAQRLGDEPAPRVQSTEVVATTEPLAALGVGGSDDHELLAWLTDFDPTTPWVRLKTPTLDGRFDPLRSTLALAPLSSKPGALPIKLASGKSSVTTLSLRAHSLGSIAFAPGRAGKNEQVLGWSGIDAGQPQVFLTLLGADGVKREQRMLTHKKGGVSDVGLGATGDGYVTAWIDERSGNPEVYALKVNAALNPAGTEQRLSRSAAAPAELAISGGSSGVLAVWSDASGSARQGRADLYALALSAKDASARGKELRLSETPEHSFSPALCARGDELVLGWLERADEGEADHALMLGVLDSSGAWKEPPERIALTQGAPAALGLSCAPGWVRAAVIVDSGERSELVVLERLGKSTSLPASVLRLAGLSRNVPQPVVRGDAVFFGEAIPGEEARIRRVLIAWH